MKDFKETTILYIEDDEDILCELYEILKMRYPIVITATNGKEGLDAIKSCNPHVVITDVQMPVMNGLEMIEVIREEYPKLPVVVTSAFSDSEYLMRAIELGVEHYIIKPINHKKLIKKIDKILLMQKQQYEVEEQNIMLQQMIELSKNPVFSIQNGDVNFANLAFLHLMGVDNIENLPKNIIEHFKSFDHLSESFVAPALFEEYILERGGSSHKVQILNSSSKGSQRVFSVDTIQSSLLSRTIFTLTDITELENARSQMVQKVEATQKELERHKRMLEIQSRMAQMGEMIEAIIHQWKQPISAMFMVVDAFEDDIEYRNLEDSERYLEYLESMDKSLKYMNTTIDDFRNFFSSNKIASRFTIKDSVDTILKMVGKKYQHNDITIESLGDMEVEIIGYPNEFKQVIINILSNSQDAFIERDIKNRKIEISAKHKLEERVIEITIEDSAGGIPENVLPRLFEPFFTTKGEKGTGIGLHIVKTIIEESMQGSIDVYNVEKGACFVITLPLEESA